MNVTQNFSKIFLDENRRLSYIRTLNVNYDHEMLTKIHFEHVNYTDKKTMNNGTSFMLRLAIRGWIKVNKVELQGKVMN